MRNLDSRSVGVPIAALSAVFLGVSPIFGKLAILAGLPPLTVVAARTAGAAALLFVALAVVNRRRFYIYPLGLIGCLIAGSLNGIGSLFYFSGLGRLDAGLAQLLYTLYPVFVAGLLLLDGQRQSHLTLLRLVISVPAVIMLTSASTASIDWAGVAYMLIAGFLYAFHIPINQRVLFEAPAPTVAFYTLLAMAGVVIPASLLFGPAVVQVPGEAIWPLLALTLVTFLSRFTLFAGVKIIGGMQAALLGLGELLIALILAQFWLNESLTAMQWLGAILLMLTLILAGRDRGQGQPSRSDRGMLAWLIRQPHQGSTAQPGEVEP